jgi:hypothetical protein
MPTGPDYVSWAWAQPTPGGATKLALLAVCSSPGDKAGDVATRTGLNCHHVQAYLATLEELELVRQEDDRWWPAPQAASEADARALAEQFWLHARPRPMLRGGLSALLPIVKQALQVGWSPDAILHALEHCPTITVAALEFELRRNKTEHDNQPRTYLGKGLDRRCETCHDSGWVYLGDEADALVRLCPSCGDTTDHR